MTAVKSTGRQRFNGRVPDGGRRAKVCPPGKGCGRILSIDRFGINRARTDGRKPYCVDCTTRIAADHYQRNRERIRKRDDRRRGRPQ